MTPRGRLMRRMGVALAAMVVLGAAVATPGTTPWPAPAYAEAHAEANPETNREANGGSVACGQADHAFTPTSLRIPGVVGRTRVLALGRDRRGVPRTPPLTEQGKWQFAWDKASGTRPGSRFGVVRLNAHTYPDFSGLALGNRLLGRLRTGATIEVSGPHGARLCYRVVRRQTVRAERSLSAYYSTSGPARLAILVCSGKRRGPGDWSHRTIWYSAPTLTSAGGRPATFRHARDRFSDRQSAGRRPPAPNAG